VFAVTASVTIALGIGATTAIFSVTNAVLLRPLPYKDPDRLVVALSDLTRRGVRDLALSAADFFDFRNGTQSSFEGVAGVYTFRYAMPRRDGTSEVVHFAMVTPNFFQVMGGRIVAGRDFEEADGLPQPPPPPPGAAATPRLPPIVILSYGYWQRNYGGDRSIFGRPMNTATGAIPVGVLAPGFELLFAPKLDVERVPDIWLAGRFEYDNAERTRYYIRPVGRLRPGVSIGRAHADVNRVTAELQKSFVIHRTAGQQFRLEPMRQNLTAEVRPALVALTGAVIFLLLISCSNVANLLLVRTGMRERELALRTALGGSWVRLMSQMLAEALLLALTGGLLGLGLAWAGIRELRAIAPANLPRLGDIAIDPGVLGFTALAALASAAMFGLVPALRAARPDIAQVLRAGGRTTGLGTTGLLRSAVVVAEVALSFVLLVGSGLMFRSFLALGRIDPGYDPRGLLTFQLVGARGGPQARAVFLREVQTRLCSIPGVQSVTASLPFPLAGGFSSIRWGLEPALADPTKFRAVDWQAVLPGYFDTMRTRLIAGRTFTDADNTPDRAVVVADEFLAAKAYPNESAVGKRILIRLRTPEAEWAEIIGVVRHQRQTSLSDPGREQVYFTDGFLSHGSVQRWAVRTAGNPAGYAAQVREVITKLEPRAGLTDVQPMSALVDKAEAGTRFSLLLIGVFAAIAALLAAVGLYGVLSTVVRQRTAEIGVRMAMGAAPASIFALMIGHGLRLSAAGVAVGLAAALALTRVMDSMLVGVKPTDPLTFAATVLLFLAIAGVSCWLPARRAAALEPTEALRRE
jgi:putative ABC transport system permease protein